jgi:fructose-1,6-bisphosphatase/inositol monophosphatase family enzyme
MAAGELHLSRLMDPGKIREKGPKDLVTEVDLLSEELLISRIRERYPRTPSSPRSRAERSPSPAVPGCSTL